MKNDGKAAWRPRRFDVAGSHPDEAWRAVANISEAVEDIRKSFIDAGYGRTFPAPVAKWQASKPLRFGNAADVQVQRFLREGVEIMDGFPPLLLGPRQREVRNRCNELAKSMEKVLARRPDEWRRGITRGKGRGR
jgi:hypothetical protein